MATSDRHEHHSLEPSWQPTGDGPPIPPPPNASGGDTSMMMMIEPAEYAHLYAALRREQVLARNQHPLRMTAARHAEWLAHAEALAGMLGRLEAMAHLAGWEV